MSMELSLTRPVDMIQGEDRTIGLTVMKNNDAFVPFDLTGVTEIVATFIKRDGSTFTKDLSTPNGIVVVDASAGRIAISLTPANTLDMKASAKQSFELAITQSDAKVRKVQVLGRLNVTAKLEC